MHCLALDKKLKREKKWQEFNLGFLSDNIKLIFILLFNSQDKNISKY